MVVGKQIGKQYLAVVHGTTQAEGRMDDYLYHDKAKNKAFVPVQDWVAPPKPITETK